MDINEHRHLGIIKHPSGETEGMDPRSVDVSLMENLGHKLLPLSKVIREKCLDCSHTAYEVAKCTATQCALRPYRMGTNPFRREPSEAQKVARRAHVEKMMAARKALRCATISRLKKFARAVSGAKSGSPQSCHQSSRMMPPPACGRRRL